MAVLVNSFSWSKSRDGLFRECKRKYYYHYYGSWGGWEADAPDEVRTLYVLKQLQSRQQWAGKLIHEAAEFALKALRERRRLRGEEFIEDTLRRMRRQWKESRRRLYWEHPKLPALFEHEYAVAVREEQWGELRDHVVRCLTNLFGLPLYQELSALTLDRWQTIEEMATWEFEGVPVYAAPDFAYWAENGALVVGDWKSGRANRNGNALQLVLYGLYAEAKWGVSLDRQRLLEVRLAEPLVRAVDVGAEAVQSARAYLSHSIRAMLDRLREIGTNTAVIDDFPRSDALGVCRWCNFRRPCRPELGA